ncbi:exodeoxyribonuclease VII large subunit [Flavobacterium sp. TAB 87]|uniref:exodeoxyribonuclease VII large subunit n=1 Tax=Flavobacterium sp. TAB 87 TaxID=1729581 RepID=UPI00076C2B5B|nr:exodeoxyribonuclease VII large subunit [Flavobacterium sp. TAB 87]KVV16231.1 Exodeoxyribonuclease 7 large subunit [Flavobacterium sp. TAB 87]
MEPQQYIRLSALNDIIHDTINSRFAGQRFWVLADITNHSFKADKKIHYFELVEKAHNGNGVTAKMLGKSWGGGAVRIEEFEKNTGQVFTNNLHVLVQVSVDYHPLYGLSVSVLDIDSNFMLGILEQQRNATLERLVNENDYIKKEGNGYSTFNSRLKLPAVIQKVAVISSISSAGNEDFRHTMQHNDFDYFFQIDDYYSAVQGANNAKLFMNKLIEIYNTGILYDAVVINRGGGSQSDFLIFDNYNIARAVAKFPIPILTGIGHQKNVSITDLMAHTHTKTPTKAAEFIIAHNRNFEQLILSLQQNIVIKSQKLFHVHYKELSELKNAISHHTRKLVQICGEELAKNNQRIISSSRSVLYGHQKKLLLTAHQLVQRPKMLLQQKKSDLTLIKNLIKNAANNYLRREKVTLEYHHKSIQLISPHNILRKGYAIVKFNEKIISSAERIQAGDEIVIILKDAKLKSTVTEKTQYDGRETYL